MAAIVKINRMTGISPGTYTDITSINTRVVANDTHSVSGTTNPIAIPNAGTNYSFWATTRLEVVSGLGGVLDNIRWYPTGTLSTGLALNGQSATSYVQATGMIGTSGDILNLTNHPGLTGAPVNLMTYSDISPKSITGSTSVPGHVGDRLVYQFAVGVTASPGAQTPITMTWKYDET